jgi:hypothetical protein
VTERPRNRGSIPPHGQETLFPSPSTEHSVQCVCKAVSSGLQGPEREADQLLVCSAEGKYAWSCTSTSSYVAHCIPR